MKYIKQLIDMIAVIEETVTHEPDVTVVYEALHIVSGRARRELLLIEDKLIEKEQLIQHMKEQA